MRGRPTYACGGVGADDVRKSSRLLRVGKLGWGLVGKKSRFVVGDVLFEGVESGKKSFADSWLLVKYVFGFGVVCF